jgi:hypothetical protein
MNYRAIISIALISSLPALASADERAAVRAACKADAQAHCSILMSRDEIISCLAKNADKISANCSSTLKVASCSDKAPADLKAAFPCAQ